MFPSHVLFLTSMLPVLHCQMFPCYLTHFPSSSAPMTSFPQRRQNEVVSSVQSNWCMMLLVPRRRWIRLSAFVPQMLAGLWNTIRLLSCSHPTGTASSSRATAASFSLRFPGCILYLEEHLGNLWLKHLSVTLRV